MLPLMLNLYVSRLKEAGAPLHPRIDSEVANHLGYVDGALKGREFFIGNALTGGTNGALRIRRELRLEHRRVGDDLRYVSDGPATKRSDQSERDSGQCRNATVHGNLPIGRVLSTVYNVRRPLAVTLLPDRTGRTNERAGVCRWG